VFFISPYYLVAKEVSIVNDAVFNSATNCHLCVNHIVKYKYLPGAVQKLQSVECISRSALLGALSCYHTLADPEGGGTRCPTDNMTDEQPDGKGQNIRDSSLSKDITLLLLRVLLFKRIVVCIKCDKTTATSGSRVGRIRRPPPCRPRT